MMWFIFAILALFSYTVWGVMNGVVAKNMDPYTGVFFSGIGYLLSGIIALFMVKFKVQVTSANLVSGVVLGIATGIGGLLVLLAIRYGVNVNIIVALTSVYPLLALLINYVLFGTTVNTIQLIGVGLAIPAVIMMSSG